MQAFLCSGLVLFVALFAVGCQSSGNGGSLKAEQIVFDMEGQISVSASEKEVACGTLKNTGTETVFTLTSPETAKGLCYQDVNGTVKISLNDLSIDGAEALLPGIQLVFTAGVSIALCKGTTSAIGKPRKRSVFRQYGTRCILCNYCKK